MGKKFCCFILVCILTVSAATIQKTYYFDNFAVKQQHGCDVLYFENAMLLGKIGEPILPYQTVSLLLPPGECAESMDITFMEETRYPEKLDLAPQQPQIPLCGKGYGTFFRDQQIYAAAESYPQVSENKLSTTFMNGHSIGLASFTPIRYIPATREIRYYRKAVVTITTRPDNSAEKALALLPSAPAILKRVRDFIQNPEAREAYPRRHVTNEDYQLLILTAADFKDSFKELIDMHAKEGIKSKVVTIDEVGSQSGSDTQEKMRNFIINEVKECGIEYVLLGGDVKYVPWRGFYNQVLAPNGSVSETEKNIPADVYFSGLDGNWNTNNNDKFGEPDEVDATLELSVARLPFNSASELQSMINKVVSYQTKPIADELNQPLLAGEKAYPDPLTWGGDYIDLLVGDHDDNGYKTIGIPPQTNKITRLYERDGNWSSNDLVTKLNAGASFLHHSGHANTSSVMKFNSFDITDQKFSKLDGRQHNFTFVYSHGCHCAQFSTNSIMEKMIQIKTFAVGVIGNSGFGWFIEGTTEGGSIHLNREFVSALYSKSTKKLGTAQLISKNKTAPYLNQTDEYEKGAQRHCWYGCNLFGDPAMNFYINKDATAIEETPFPVTEQSKLKDNILVAHGKNGIVIDFGIQKASAVRMDIFSTKGQRITTLVNTALSKGNHSITWNFNSDISARIAKGMYILHLTTDTYSLAKHISIVQ